MLVFIAFVLIANVTLTLFSQTDYTNQVSVALAYAQYLLFLVLSLLTRFNMSKQSTHRFSVMALNGLNAAFSVYALFVTAFSGVGAIWPL
tara:strand:- start:212 stop:481 length:270 start_codon:yes stop_codon:yes gene_type:complete